ncbi:arginine deiminase family protein [Sporolactobacillus sp. STSJ-5]|uniref:dimethylarginine dimethylaminohydrolase family protein n=1 Tax=Sporolactobacillus sp. STSJ-5 TaxID=2965076 RepID=UPI002101EAB2|nr:arginine deiminase family protein [Sporolactobacillus sp. STSJ-5]MCQ2011360.1 arginine deiminase family protein [Sporolactobacillus sp. STSJ-5]
MPNIHIVNEYDPLKTVVLGIADKLYFPGTHDIEMEDESAWWKKLLNVLIYRNLERKRVPSFLEKKFQKELRNFEQVLKTQGIEVIHLDEVVPLENESSGLGQMYARDAVFCVGENMIAGNLQIEMRKKERRGFESIFSKYDDGTHVQKLDPQGSAFLEGGDVMVDYPYVYVGIGKYASNMEGAEWLQKFLGSEVKVVPVHLKNEGILHLDCCMTIIGEKTGIIHRPSLEDPLPYPLNTYDFIEVDSKVRHEMGTNVLVLAPDQVVVQKRHKDLQKELQDRGYEVFPLDFTWHTRLDGAFRCTTCPVVRENTPKQK